jgi:hypothetical protein
VLVWVAAAALLTAPRRGAHPLQPVLVRVHGVQHLFRGDVLGQLGQLRVLGRINPGVCSGSV